jgi:hypothetical protein
LIEAALALPDWLDVDTSTNRIWIHQGRLCIIPPSQQYIDRVESGGPVPPLPQVALESAIQRVCTDPKSCYAPETVFSIIQKRLQGYPELAHANNTHWTLCSVPLKVARLLEADPSLVADAVRGFYHRDPISLKESVKMRFLGPHQPQVNMMVRLSRCMYAQLLRQEFYPPLVFGSHTKPSDAMRQRGGNASQQIRQHDSWLLGSKLAVGLEIAYSEVRSKRLRRLASSFVESTPDSTVTPSYPFDQDEDWLNYKRQITELGYFQSQVEGAPLYRSLERKAKLKFLTSAETKMSSLLAQAGPEAVKLFETDDYTDQTYLNIKLDAILQRATEETAQHFQARLKLFDDSSDAWLNISPAELDEIIATREGKDHAVRDELKTASLPKQKKKKSPDASDDDSDAEEDGMVFDDMVRDMRKFMLGMSGVDGVGDDADDPLASASVGPMDPKKFAELMKKTLGEEGIDVGAGQGGDEDDDFYAMGSDDDEEDEDEDGEVLSKDSMRKLMKQMERELDSHGLRDEFERLDLDAPSKPAAARRPAASSTASSTSSALGGDSGPAQEDAPIDLNLNLVKNFLESYGAQQGLAGPVSNILGDMRRSQQKK